MEITYLLNSGFMVRDKNILIVFDDFDDPAKVVDRAFDDDFKYLYIFASHAHFDHFDTHIRAYAPKVSRYIFSNDIRRTKRVKMFPSDKITYMKKYSDWQDDIITVKTFDSTDVGVSFLVEFADNKIFHAGDFNWWDWYNDTPAQRMLAEKTFKRQLKKMQGLEVDVAFFPVDGRLGESQERGVTEFVNQVRVKKLIAMHRVGYPAWRPSRRFLDSTPEDIKIWSPVNSGEKLVVS